MEDTLQNYLRDLIFLLKEDLSQFGEDSSLSDFKAGEKFGITKTLSLIESQAFAFGIDLETFGFNDFEKSQNRLKGKD